MSELYWLSVLGKLSNLFFVGIIIFSIVLIGAGVVYISAKLADFEEEYFHKQLVISLKIVKISFLTLAFCGAAYCFTPSTQQLYAIYGIGSVVDYVQDSDEAKKIPDNAVKAINKYLESMSEDDKQDK